VVVHKVAPVTMQTFSTRVNCNSQLQQPSLPGIHYNTMLYYSVMLILSSLFDFQVIVFIKSDLILVYKYINIL